MRLVVALLIVGTLLAGCAGHPAETNSAPPSNGTPAGSTNASAPGAFLLLGPLLRDASGQETDTFHEDDVAKVHYEISLTSTARSDATGFASYIVNGKVLDVQTVHLQPGEHHAFDQTVSLANMTALHVEVKVGAADGKTDAKVVRWPRLGGALTLGNLTATLTDWQNATDRVYVSVDLATPADGTVVDIHVKLLCYDAKGKLGVRADQQPTPMPGETTPTPLDYPACGAPYGIQVDANDGGTAQTGRILFA